MAQSILLRALWLSHFVAFVLAAGTPTQPQNGSLTRTQDIVSQPTLEDGNTFYELAAEYLQKHKGEQHKDEVAKRDESGGEVAEDPSASQDEDSQDQGASQDEDAQGQDGSQDKDSKHADSSNLTTEYFEAKIKSESKGSKFIFYASPDEATVDQRRDIETSATKFASENQGLTTRTLVPSEIQTPDKNTSAPNGLDVWENASRAMAQQASGPIYVVTSDPLKLASYKAGIWHKVEWPALLERHKAGASEGPATLIGVDSADSQNQYVLDWETLDYDKNTTQRLQQVDWASVKVADDVKKPLTQGHPSLQECGKALQAVGSEPAKSLAARRVNYPREEGTAQDAEQCDKLLDAVEQKGGKGDKKGAKGGVLKGKPGSNLLKPGAGKKSTTASKTTATRTVTKSTTKSTPAKTPAKTPVKTPASKPVTASTPVNTNINKPAAKDKVKQSNQPGSRVKPTQAKPQSSKLRSSKPKSSKTKSSKPKSSKTRSSTPKSSKTRSSTPKSSKSRESKQSKTANTKTPKRANVNQPRGTYQGSQKRAAKPTRF